MTLTVRLAGWEAKGLRCPDHKVSFETTAGSTHPISLIQMPNGTGKTTTLTLLRATLSGSPPSGPEWSPDLIQEFRKNADTESGSFQVSLLHNQKRITITLHFDFEQLEVRYSTTNRRGNEPGFHPPRGLDRFLNAYFANFFVFDGELAESLLDRSKTDAEEVIDKLFQLTHFDGMSGWADSYWKERTAAKAKAANTSSSTLKGLTQWRGRVDRYTARLKYLQDEQQRLVTEQRSLRRRLKKLQAESEAAMKAKADIGKEITQAEGSLKLAEAEVRRQTDALLHRFRSPHAISADFASSMLDFKEALDRVKLPESAARDFFEELAKEETCVCGRPLDPASRQAILNSSLQQGKRLRRRPGRPRAPRP